MRNNYIVKITFAVLALAACKPKPPAMESGHAEHPVDSSVANLTRPVNEKVIAAIPVISADTGTRVYATVVNGIVTYDDRNQTSIASRVGGRVERLLVKFNYQPVKKGQLIMEVYSPDLAAAQRELLYVAQTGGNMLAAAKQRLQLLGMQAAQIEQVIKTGKVLYRVPVYSNANGYILEKSAAAAPTAAMPAVSAAGGDGMSGMGATTTAATPAPAAPAATPVLLREGQYVTAGQSLFTIYQATSLVAEFAFPAQLSAMVKKGQQLLFYPASNEDAMQSGHIGLIEPRFKDGVNFTMARVYLKDHALQAGQLLQASLPVVVSAGWWLPQKAVLQLGNKSVVFKKEGNAFIPKVVETGWKVKDMIQVKTAIGDWKLASNAYYLVDSESFIRTKN
ncbi:Multidrug efflux pump subunit AcrA (membrane-fusion protein) [Chitinophaga jiangningensis]|uniref:Multidrug efflux pump subunit AcrA (Membrane-fusion protein) n=1 Tax=Chitinophaga jiangningensis TaxID=1419482 RepID=A0A1M7KKV9_9BACT|nr:efflux RND transporter periplasmic adaptor subunit [Chitinophaga jiangningensis]SHM65576.1 Multidrug efflux pump subunit AcrA (membrane-fusion protein) [Chitinophaga jiangningensis]